MSVMRGRLPSRENPVDRLVAYISSLGKLASKSLDTLKHLQNETISFGHLSLIPRLVTLYEWLYDNLGHAITEEQAADMSIEAAFELLA